MKPQLLRSTDPELNKLITQLSAVLSAIDGDNFRSVTIKDTTSSSANTSKKVKHGRKRIPIPIVLSSSASIYYSVDDTFIDVRSASTSVTFTLLLIG